MLTRRDFLQRTAAAVGTLALPIAVDVASGAPVPRAAPVVRLTDIGLVDRLGNEVTAKGYFRVPIRLQWNAALGGLANVETVAFAVIGEEPWGLVHSGGTLGTLSGWRIFANRDLLFEGKLAKDMVLGESDQLLFQPGLLTIQFRPQDGPPDTVLLVDGQTSIRRVTHATPDSPETRVTTYWVQTDSPV